MPHAKCILTGDKEIKEQFLGRRQEIEQKVPSASACEVTRKATFIKDIPNLMVEVLDDSSDLALLFK